MITIQNATTGKTALSKDADGRYRIDFPNHFTMPHAVVFELNLSI